VIRVAAVVRRALDAGKPVAALESSVLAQGLPVPENAEAARRMISAVERAGAIPAITAVARGEATLGLEPDELERFLKRDGVRKVSARDLGVAIAEKADGATTVAATLAIGGQLGVKVMATGGIGGVHRKLPGDASIAVDESADLLELAQTPMVCVCSGAKVILDLPATWERLDTLGIPVIGVGTDELPGFYTAGTGIKLGARAKDADEVTRIAEAHWSLGRRQAVLVVQPVPPKAAMDSPDVERAVADALKQASAKGVSGAAVTPFLLAELSRITGRRTLDANLALLEANAQLAGEIAFVMSGG
jgi:pseudouridine-5'-phosphate glycosidase